MEQVRITEKSVAVPNQPGHYRVMVSTLNPSDDWQAAFLKEAEKDTDGRRLALKSDGSTITYRLLEGKAPAECEQMIQGFMDQVGKR